MCRWCRWRWRWVNRLINYISLSFWIVKHLRCRLTGKRAITAAYNRTKRCAAQSIVHDSRRSIRKPTVRITQLLGQELGCPSSKTLCCCSVRNPFYNPLAKILLQLPRQDRLHVCFRHSKRQCLAWSRKLACFTDLPLDILTSRERKCCCCGAKQPRPGYPRKQTRSTRCRTTNSRFGRHSRSYCRATKSRDRLWRHARDLVTNPRK